MVIKENGIDELPRALSTLLAYEKLSSKVESVNRYECREDDDEMIRLNVLNRKESCHHYRS